MSATPGLFGSPMFGPSSNTAPTSQLSNYINAASGQPTGSYSATPGNLPYGQQTPASSWQRPSMPTGGKYYGGAFGAGAPMGFGGKGYGRPEQGYAVDDGPMIGGGTGNVEMNPSEDYSSEITDYMEPLSQTQGPMKLPGATMPQLTGIQHRPYMIAKFGQNPY